MLSIILNSFCLIALSEIGDKTQLLALSLAASFKKPKSILLGIFLATLLKHTLASTLGSWLAFQIKPRLLSGILATIFIVSGVWSLKPDHLVKAPPLKYGALLTTFILFFLAEMGDKTQLATIALAAKYESALWVTFGTTLGILAADGLVVFIGDRLSRRLNLKWIRRLAASSFFGLGLLSAYQALFGI